MSLDQQVCSRARLARDARFDGKFFIAVLTTRIYCRPVCPSRTSKEENVRYFPSAAAAAEAGFRPCLRCRPECSPGTPAGLGTSNTVSRALRLIGETGLEEGGVDLLAERLGVGSRHLRRLFLKHLGATPTAVAQTRRLQFAKKLIDETTLPMTEIAFASGFGSVRRFNAAIRETYHRTPTEIRRVLKHPQPGPADTVAFTLRNHYRFSLSFRPPFPLASIFAFLAASAIPGVEVVEGQTYRRSISLNGSHGYLEVSPDQSKNAVFVRIEFGDSHSLFAIVERVRAMFDLNADWPAIERTLEVDPVLRPLLRKIPGLRVPGCWNSFELATLAILGQERSVAHAVVDAASLVHAFGEPFSPASGLTHLFPAPGVLAAADLLSLGIPRQRAETIRALAAAVQRGWITFDMIADAEAFLARLRAIPGLGSWAAEYIALRALREPDAFPSTDASLLQAIGPGDAYELERRSEAWRPWRSYAAMYLWHESTPLNESTPRKTVTPDDAYVPASDRRSAVAVRQSIRRTGFH